MRSELGGKQLELEFGTGKQVEQSDFLHKLEQARARKGPFDSSGKLEVEYYCVESLNKAKTGS